MIYLWVNPDIFPKGDMGIHDPQRSPDRFRFREAISLDKDLGTHVFRVNSVSKIIRKYDVLINNVQLPVVGPRALRLLMDIAGGDFQVFDARVESKDGVVEGFKVLNIVQKVEAIDHSSSKYTYVAGTNVIAGFESLALRENALGERNLARDAEYLGNILVSERIQKAFEKEFIEGIRLVTPERYFGPK